MITILGPTASGKTSYAAALAKALGRAEIISADSRQVYRGMNLGTGKDLEDYVVDGTPIPYHLIDIADPGEKYNVFLFQRDFLQAYHDIVSRGRTPILCGGTGLYIESVLRGYRMSEVPQNPELRQRLEGKSLAELTRLLSTYITLHNTTDVDTAQRAVRAIEIADYYKQHPAPTPSAEALPHWQERSLHSLVIGLDISRDLRRQRITRRLEERLDNGMLDEVRRLLAAGVKSEDLIYYGLEYKYLTLHVLGRLSYAEMFRQLETAIHQFAKRQMTWFRGMERRGVTIHWIDATWPTEKKIEETRRLCATGSFL